MGQPGEGDDFSMAVERHGDDAVMRMAGALDLRTVTRLESFAREVLTQRPARLDLDAGRLEFMDISGMVGLLEVRRAAIAAGAQFRLVNARDTVRRTIEIAGLTDLLLPDD